MSVELLSQQYHNPDARIHWEAAMPAGLNQADIQVDTAVLHTMLDLGNYTSVYVLPNNRAEALRIAQRDGFDPDVRGAVEDWPEEGKNWLLQCGTVKDSSPDAHPFLRKAIVSVDTREGMTVPELSQELVVGLGWAAAARTVAKPFLEGTVTGVAGAFAVAAVQTGIEMAGKVEPMFDASTNSTLPILYFLALFTAGAVGAGLNYGLKMRDQIDRRGLPANEVPVTFSPLGVGRFAKIYYNSLRKRNKLLTPVEAQQ